MKMKKLFTAVCALMLSFSLHAQVKNYIGIVRETHYKSYDDFLEDLSTYLKKNGYTSYSEYVDSYRKGGFGSGFVYVDNNGTNYIITNRHVVSQAASASIEFENDDGSTTKYDNLSVLITDDDIDIAILQFANGKNPFKTGLTFNTKKLTDGQDVVSAGFPGLGGDPVWQFGKGSVTNSSARIRDLIDPSISTVIQHSAQIDAGNSGGPLLVSAKNSALGYEVAGINTWKAIGREATNFAIPSSLSLKLIEKSKQTIDDETAKSERKEKFKQTITDASNDYTSIVKFISYDLASSEGINYFEDILKHASSKISNRIISEFAYNPIEGLRYAVAYNIYDELSGKNATDETLSNITWNKEHGLYRISSIKKNAKTKNNNTSKDSKIAEKNSDGIPNIIWPELEPPYIFAINGGVWLPITLDSSNAILSPSFNCDLFFYFNNFGLIGAVFEFEHGKYNNTDFNAIGIGPSARFPLNFNLFCITPKASAGVKLVFADPDPMLLQLYAEAGIELVFNFGGILRPGIEAGCRATSASSNDKSIDTSGIGPFVKLVLGLQF